VPKPIKITIVKLRRDESGQGLGEYALLLALVALLAVGALQLVGGGITSILSTAGSGL
jgi:pilus assembly protein Flp/PilA